MTAAHQAAARLLEGTDALARAITDRLYAERPELEARYGAVGRRRCLEDIRHTLDHLIPAVDLAHPTLFADYVRWLDGLLRARHVDPADLVRSLELTEQVLAEQLAEAEAEAVRPVLRAGLGVLGAGDAA